MQIPSLASIYLYALMKTEPALCKALYSRLEAATNRQEIRFLVALYMTACAWLLRNGWSRKTREIWFLAWCVPGRLLVASCHAKAKRSVVLENHL